MSQPIAWDEIHTNALQVKSRADHRRFCSWIRDTILHMTCGICKNHGINYITAHPPENKRNLFKWTWRYHNDVNQTLGKETFKYKAAKRYYS